MKPSLLAFVVLLAFTALAPAATAQGLTQREAERAADRAALRVVSGDRERLFTGRCRERGRVWRCPYVVFFRDKEGDLFTCANGSRMAITVRRDGSVTRRGGDACRLPA